MILGYTHLGLNAANAYFHKVEKVDALSISGGTTLTVYGADGTTVIARITTSATVTDLSARYDETTGNITLSSTDEGISNGLTKVTVEFLQYGNDAALYVN